MPHVKQDGASPGNTKGDGVRTSVEAVIGLATLVAQFGVNRLGICAIASCPGVFIDASTNRSRRYCADHCTARINVTAIREQRRTENTRSAATAAS